MQGLIRPCRHRLGASLNKQWRAHLCGLCLTLRDEAGQTARILTGYDALLLSVLVEAQAGALVTTTAGRCPLRGMRTAEVVSAAAPAAQLAAAGALLTGAASLQDKLTDGDLPYGTRPVARLAARRFGASGVALADRVALAASPVLRAPVLAAELEGRAGQVNLDELLAPTGDVVSGLFAHTAVVAGRPRNALALGRAGQAYGRLVHLLDAVDDLDEDAGRDRFNPLTATATATEVAEELARSLSGQVTRAVGQVVMELPELARLLLGPELDRAVDRAFPKPGRSSAPIALAGALAGTLAVTTLTTAPPRRRRQRWECGDGSCLDPCDPCCSNCVLDACCDGGTDCCGDAACDCGSC